MNFSFLSAVAEDVLAHNTILSELALGRKLKIHTEEDGIPDLDGVAIAIIGVLENRNAINYSGNEVSLDAVRKELYSLFPGNWSATIADLGDIKRGESTEDTYFALKETISILVTKQIIPVIVGGSQDLTYCAYRAYDELVPMVNLVNVDAKFDLGDSSKPIKNDCFVGKIILDKPYNLFNYSTIGYQTYFNSQEEIDLMQKLYFESFRLGEVSNNISVVEPVMRDADIVSIDMNVVKHSEMGLRSNNPPNGLDGKEICAIARYAGISDKVSTFGVFEYEDCEVNTVSAKLISQILWYFIEGVNCRVEDDLFSKESNYQKFITLIDAEELVFYKSTRSGRWWIEMPFLSQLNNNLKSNALLACTEEDYLDACDNIIPERWYKAMQRNLL